VVSIIPPYMNSTENCRILMVDDDELVIKSFERAFSEYGPQMILDKTTDSLRALKMIEDNIYDIVITDLVMPDVDGIQVLRKVKELNPDTEVILITAYSSYDSALDAMHFGAFDYIPKPFNPQDLKMRIIQAIKKRRAIVEKNQKIQEIERLCFTIAHDFKASILSIKSFSQIILQDYGGKLGSDGKFLIDRIGANVSIMESMVGALLEYAKIGKMRIEWENIDTKEFFIEILTNFKPSLQKENIRLELQDDLPLVNFYREGLRRVILNLIENAIKYARKDADSYIKIGVTNPKNPLNGKYRFFIEDNGKGIAPENLHLIFEIFQRVDKTEKKGGYGLGLAIVKKILESAHCDIQVESIYGEKTVFYFTLPVAKK